MEHGLLQEKNFKGTPMVSIVKLQTLRSDFENVKLKYSKIVKDYYYSRLCE